ncbi:MBL fold metallo-hydrolase [Amycolatopsis sp. NBC_00355]|uniref:MBL fold metallo-hydrolase n=1 Tax=Amycolatopsis sp. NBC_00355 TaxID=2975957 RepID=UPI002E277462
MPAVTANIVPLRHARPGVVAYVKSPDEWFVANSGWIQGSEGVALIDTCGTEQATLELVRDVRKYAPESARQLTVVVTHAHGEHHNGVGVALRDGGTVLAAPASVEVVKAGPQTYGNVFTCTQWGVLEPPEPAAVRPVVGWKRLDLGDAVADVVAVPGTAHTAGDLVVHEPRSGTLFTGDLVFIGSTPMAVHGSIPGWLDALDWLQDTFRPRTLVPGHGPVANPGHSAVHAMRVYLEWLLDATARSRDFSKLATQASLRWPTWSNPERHIGNLMRAYADQHGRKLDVDLAVDAVIAAAGGRIDLDYLLGAEPVRRIS